VVLWHYTSPATLPAITAAGYLDVSAARDGVMGGLLYCYTAPDGALYHDPGDVEPLLDGRLLRFTIAVPVGDIAEHPLPPGMPSRVVEMAAASAVVRRRVPSSEWLAVEYRAAVDGEWLDGEWVADRSGGGEIVAYDKAVRAQQ
jgi:hypothetical protein